MSMCHSLVCSFVDFSIRSRIVCLLLHSIVSGSGRNIVGASISRDK